MHKLKVFHILSLIFLNSFASFGQGLIFNDSIKSQMSSYAQPTLSRSPLPSSFSLKPYAPYVHFQLGSECVAYSFASAHSILYAIANGWTDQEQISQNSFSPHFIYYRNKAQADNECTIGLDPFKVSEDILATGMAKLSDVECPDYYPCSMESRLCEYYPPSYALDLLNAGYHKLDNVYLAENIQEIRSCIYASLPVVLGMSVTESFRNAKDLWVPAPNESPADGYGHALVVVAYDDDKYGGAMQLLNSWGEGWGNEGYTWVKYDDLQNFAQFGLALERKIGNYGAAAPDGVPSDSKYLEREEADKSLIAKDKNLGMAAPKNSKTNRYVELIKGTEK